MFHLLLKKCMIVLYMYICLPGLIMISSLFTCLTYLSYIIVLCVSRYMCLAELMMIVPC